MKHNLANKPKLYKIPSNLTGHLNFEVEVIEWFEAFEKELQEILRCCQASKYLWNQKADFIREILGEEK